MDRSGENRVQIGIALPCILLGTIESLVFEVFETREELKAQEVALMLTEFVVSVSGLPERTQSRGYATSVGDTARR